MKYTKISENAADEISRRLPKLHILRDEDMKKHCSFKIGGKIRALAEPESEDELIALLSVLKEMGIRPLIMGRGTNILFKDSYMDFLILRIHDKMSGVKREGESLIALAGTSLRTLAESAKKEGLSGLEFAGEIPGGLGGAVFMNAGAFGGEMKDVVSSVFSIGENLSLKERTNEELDFSYRHSVFEEKEDECIVKVKLSLSIAPIEEIAEKMREICEKRRSSQVIKFPSAGSFFKRPEGHFAAKLIDEAGLKGLRVGDAMISEMHAGFLVNVGSATAADVLRLMEKVQSEVLKKFGVELKPEVRIIGG